MSEKQIQNNILSFLKIKGVLAWENQSVGIFDPIRKVYRKKQGIHRKVGVSDILGIHDGKFLAIEVKALKGKPTPAQIIFLDEVNQHGGIAFIARSIDDVAKKLGIAI